MIRATSLIVTELMKDYKDNLINSLFFSQFKESIL